MSKTKEECFKDVLYIMKRKYIVLAYFYNNDFYPQSIFINFQNNQKLKEVYIFLVKEKYNYLVITGNIHMYFNNNAIGAYESGFSSFELDVNIFYTLNEGVKNFYDKMNIVADINVNKLNYKDSTGNYLYKKFIKIYKDILWIKNKNINEKIYECFFADFYDLNKIKLF